jgi:hypothetical protein
MKYFIVRLEQEYTIYKVAENLIPTFEKEYHENVLAKGNSLMEVILDFERVKQLENLEGIELIPAKFCVCHQKKL